MWFYIIVFINPFRNVLQCILITLILVSPRATSQTSFFFFLAHDFREKIPSWWAGQSKWGGCVCSHHGGVGKEVGTMSTVFFVRLKKKQIVTSRPILGDAISVEAHSVAV